MINQVSLLVAFVLAVVEYLIDHVFDDQESRLYKWLRRSVLPLLGFALIFSFVQNYYIQKDSTDATARLDRIKDQNDSLKVFLRANEIAWRERMTALQDSVSSLGAKLENFKPFVNLAVYRHPNLDTLSALRQLYNEMESLKQDVQRVATQYEFRSLSEERRNFIIAKLRNCSNCKDISFSIINISAEHVNDLVSAEIVQMLKAAGLGTDQSRGWFEISLDVKPAVLIIKHSTLNRSVIDEFTKALSVLFTDFRPSVLTENSLVEPGQLKVMISGSPKFDQYGRISFH